MTPSNIDSPDGNPTDGAETIDGCSERDLREVFHYAQQLLGGRLSLTAAIEARPGEDLVRVEDYDAYTIAVVKRPDEAGDACLQFAYRVKWGPNIDSGTGTYRWHYLGKVLDESGDH